MYQYLMQQGKALQQQPYQAYQGTLVPDVNSTQQASVNQSNQYSQAAQPYLSQAGQMTQQAAAGYNPQNYAQGVAGYMSPYMQQAMGATAAQMNNVNQQQQQQLLGDTIKQGAFGGDRGQIAQAALMNQQNLAMGNVLSNMANTGYNTAASNYLQGLNQQGQLASQYGNIGNLAQTAGMTGAAQLGTAGGIPYAVQQAQNAANYQQYAQQQAYPMQTLGFLANMASGLGAGQGGTSATTQPGGNIMSQVLGLGTAFLTSDERAKDNMEPVGKTFDGQNIYRYNYKGSPTTQLGLSAQEVEKHNPDAVAKDNNGMRMVDYSQATSDAADKGHFAAGGSSQGGLVPSSLERHPFATSGGVGYGMIPFEDDPLTQEMALLSKLSLGSWVPKLAIEGGKGVGIPEAPTPEKQDMADVTSLGNFGSALYKKGGTYVTNNLAKATAGSSFKNPTSDYWTYAFGGLVPRVPHADGEAADPTIDKTVRSLGDVGSQVGSFVNGLRSTDTEPGLIGNLFNAGKPLDEAARFGIMSAGLAVAADPSQNVLQAIGRGGLTGANAYSNRLKAQNEYNQKLAEQALKGREIDISAQGNVYRGMEATNAMITNRYNILNTLRAQAASLTASGQPIPADLQNNIDTLTASITALSLSGIGAGPTPDVSKVAPAIVPLTQPSVVAPSATNAPAVKTVPSVSPTVTSEPGTVVKQLETNKPEPKPEVVTEGQPSPVVAAAVQALVPQVNDPSFLSKLDPNNNPKVLRDRAAEVSLTNPELATKLREEARKVQDNMLEKGVGTGPNGELVKVPGWDKWKTDQENIKSNAEFFNKQASDALSRQNARLQLDSIKKIVETFQPNAFAEQFADLQRFLNASGIQVPDSAKVNAVAFQSFLKDTLRQIYSDVKQYSGGVKVAELAGLEKQAPSAVLEPGTVENIMSQLDGNLDYADKHFDEATNYRKSHQGYFDQADFEKEFLSKYKLPEFADKAYKNIAVYGALPTKKSELVAGKTYIIDRAPNGTPVKPTKKRFIKLSDTGNPIFADVQ
jgi:hypothetical protein